MSNFNSADIAAFKDVWVFCEQREGKLMPTDFELISKGRDLANELGVNLCGLLLGGEGIESAAKELGGHGVTAKVDGRTVAAGNARLMAKLNLSAPEVTEPGTIVHVAIEGKYAGYLLIADVVKPHSAQAIKGLKQAGVRKTVMLTGDAEPVAKAVSAELGLDEYHAGLLPGDKVDQIEKLLASKQPKENLAFVGDGVNDAPSIKRADIGVGMGITGTDVTKNVADMVLADDNFATIIGACEEGRRIYDNIRKVIQFLLSANLAEVFSVFIATLIGFTIFQPVQLLWVNLVTDCFPALALGMEDAEGDIMKRKPRNAKDGVFAGHMGLDCVVQGLIITALVLASFFVGVYFDMGYIHIADMIAGNADEEGVMMAFITLNMVEIFHCFNMRSRRASLFTMKKQNKWLWASAALALVLTVIVTVQPTLAEMFFGPVTLELKGVVAALGLAFLIIPLMEIYKAIMRAVEKE